MKTLLELESDTPLRPRAIAEAVWEEASLWLGEPLPRRWLRELIAEANSVYANNARFRRKLRAEGDSGREWLWLFTRHWLAALMHERRPGLHKRLLASFNRGEPLPEDRSLRMIDCARVESPHRRSRVDRSRAFAMAAHFYG